MRLDLEEAGLSAMQRAETTLAAKFGVPLIAIRFDAASTEDDVRAQLEGMGGDGSSLRTDLAAGPSAESPLELEVRRLREQNSQLREEVSQLQQQIHDLQAS